MNINHLKGDLLSYLRDGTVQAIAHCCNCMGVMGSGIAAKIATEFPEAEQAYLHFKESEGLKLGTISYASWEGENTGDRYVTVFNLHAQQSYGRGDRHVNYESLYKCLEQVREVMVNYPPMEGRLGIPYKMACDRAGGDWIVVAAMIHSVFENSGIEVTICEL